ncbi:MAG: insulinase family protein [Candidatus Methanomethylophilaceae archaeon]|nr:insulinase family protein [Candidatus Methanomethylophilaceae archaeon]
MPSNTVTMRHTSGGIPVVTEEIPGAISSGYMVGVNTGSRDESPDIFGLSHLLEHVVFRATKTRTSFQMSKEIEGAGGEMNAFTAKEMTAFYAVTIKDTAKVAKDLVADIVSNPLIGKDDTELEKKIVLQEISMVENEPDSYIHDLFDMAIWKGHELSQAEAGTRDVVKGLTNVDLRKYYDERYRIPNLCVFACGAVDPDDVVAWAEQNFDRMSGGHPNPRKRPEITGSGYTFHKRKEDHCYVGMGFRAYDAKSKDRAALQLLNAVLGSGSSSRLFQSVREEKALVYSVYNYVGQFSDASTFATFMSSTEENVLEAIETTAKTYRLLKENGLTEGELARARNLVKGALTRYMESTSHRLYRLARNTMLTGEPERFEDRLAALDAVTEEDVMRVAEDIIDPKGLNVVMFGNDVKDMRKFSVDQLDF